MFACINSQKTVFNNAQKQQELAKTFWDIPAGYSKWLLNQKQ